MIKGQKVKGWIKRSKKSRTGKGKLKGEREQLGKKKIALGGGV